MVLLNDIAKTERWNLTPLPDGSVRWRNDIDDIRKGRPLSLEVKTLLALKEAGHALGEGKVYFTTAGLQTPNLKGEPRKTVATVRLLYRKEKWSTEDNDEWMRSSHWARVNQAASDAKRHPRDVVLYLDVVTSTALDGKC